MFTLYNKRQKQLEYFNERSKHYDYNTMYDDEFEEELYELTSNIYTTSKKIKESVDNLRSYNSILEHLFDFDKFH